MQPAAVRLISIAGDRPEPTFRIGWSGDGHILLTGHRGQRIRLWDVPSGRPLRTIRGEGGSFALSPTAPLLARVLRGRLCVSHLGSKQALQRPAKIPGGISDLAWAPDGRHLFIAARSGEIGEFDFAARVRQAFAVVSSEICELKVGLSGDIYARGTDGLLYRIDRVRGRAKAIASDVTALAVAPTGSFALGTEAGRIVISPRDDNAGVAGEFVAGAAPVRSLSFSADGRFLASKCEDTKLIIWRAQSDPAPVAVTSEQVAYDDDDQVFWSSAMAFNPAGTYFASSERATRIWKYQPEALVSAASEDVSWAAAAIRGGPSFPTSMGAGQADQRKRVLRTDYYQVGTSFEMQGNFRPKNSTPYVVTFGGGEQVKKRAHEDAVVRLAQTLERLGGRVSSPHPIDLVMYAPGPILFEAKHVGDRHPGHAIREAIGQLLEYRYFVGPRSAELCIFLDVHPRDPRLVQFVEEELSMMLAWDQGSVIVGGPATAAHFRELGLDLKSSDEAIS